ncbi:hypothetical protein ACLESD_38005 [Pyxidicoccus sp. 3LFB2]
MSLGRVTLLLVVALGCACGSSASFPAPDILSVAPNQLPVPREVPADKRDPIRVSLDAVIPVRVDYSHEQVRTDAARVWIGSEEASVTSLDRDGTLVVEVPVALDQGTYDVRVSLSDGREAMRPAVLTLIPEDWGRQSDAGMIDLPEEQDAGPLILLDGGTPDASTPDAGPPPVEPGPNDPIVPGDITGFIIEAVGDQQRGTPFLVIVHALGPRAAHFQDSVELTLNKKGTLSPLKLGPFDNGVVGQYVTVDAKGGNLKLTVTDAFGAQGTSNGFKVQ